MTARDGILLVALGLGVSLLAVAAGDAGTAARETARLNAWLDARYTEELQQSPMRLTQLGRKERYDEIDDFSEAGDLAEYQLLERSVAELRKQFDYEQLTPEGKISYDFWVYRLHILQESLPFLRHPYQFGTQGGAHSDLPDFLINMHSVDTRREMQDYIARIKAIARALRQSLERAQVAAAEGIRPPRFAYESAIEIAGNIIRGAPFTADATDDSPLWADARGKIASLQARGIIDARTAGALRAETAAALKDSLLPAYRELISWLQADLPHADRNARGVAALPNGRQYYDYTLAYYTTTRLTAQQIHALGLAEVARIREDIEALMTKLAFEGSMVEFFDFVRTDPRFYFSNDEAGRQAYINLSRHYIDTMYERLPGYFGILPRGGLLVKRVEPFMEQDGMSAFYVEGTADGSRPGVYYLHLSDMTALNKTDIESTAYHEGIPGHHMQIAIALEQSELPAFRHEIWHAAYGEGWALYAEYLAREMGAFEDSYSDFGRLSWELVRAVRLVVDTGLHALGWSEQEAVDYMLANTAVPELSVRSEVQRYLEDPGQATSYKVGMVKLLELREHARGVLGEQFDIRDFHDTVLGGGSLPLPILERRVTEWTAARAANATGQLPPGD